MKLPALKLGKRTLISVPTIWLLLFFAIPFLIVLKISFSMAAVAIPPYEPLFQFFDETFQISLNFGNYLLLLDDPLYAEAFLGSLKIASVSTLLALALGYPIALGIARASPRWQSLLLLLIILPSWTSFLIRVYAWMGLLSNSGLINSLLISIGFIEEPIQMLNTDFAVYVGIVYCYLPFMVLPLYANLVKQDPQLLEAASDLGASRVHAFLSITLPLSLGGIIAGSMLVFIPVVGEFVIPELLGGPDSLMIGKVLWQEFFNNRDWPVASALAITLLVILIIPIAWFNAQQSASLEDER